MGKMAKSVQENDKIQ